MKMTHVPYHNTKYSFCLLLFFIVLLPHTEYANRPYVALLIYNTMVVLTAQSLRQPIEDEADTFSESSGREDKIFSPYANIQQSRYESACNGSCNGDWPGLTRTSGSQSGPESPEMQKTPDENKDAEEERDDVKRVCDDDRKTIDDREKLPECVKPSESVKPTDVRRENGKVDRTQQTYADVLQNASEKLKRKSKSRPYQTSDTRVNGVIHKTGIINDPEFKDVFHCDVGEIPGVKEIEAYFSQRHRSVPKDTFTEARGKPRNHLQKLHKVKVNCRREQDKLKERKDTKRCSEGDCIEFHDLLMLIGSRIDVCKANGTTELCYLPNKNVQTPSFRYPYLLQEGEGAFRKHCVRGSRRENSKHFFMAKAETVYTFGLDLKSAVAVADDLWGHNKPRMGYTKLFCKADSCDLHTGCIPLVSEDANIKST